MEHMPEVRLIKDVSAAPNDTDSNSGISSYIFNFLDKSKILFKPKVLLF